MVRGCVSHYLLWKLERRSIMTSSVMLPLFRPPVFWRQNWSHIKQSVLTPFPWRRPPRVAQIYQHLQRKTDQSPRASRACVRTYTEIETSLNSLDIQFSQQPRSEVRHTNNHRSASPHVFPPPILNQLFSATERWCSESNPRHGASPRLGRRMSGSVSLKKSSLPDD